MNNKWYEEAAMQVEISKQIMLGYLTRKVCIKKLLKIQNQGKSKDILDIRHDMLTKVGLYLYWAEIYQDLLSQVHLLAEFFFAQVPAED